MFGIVIVCDEVVYTPDREDRRKAGAAAAGTATAAAGGSREAPAALQVQLEVLQLGAPKPNAPLACAACCGRCESPS